MPQRGRKITIGNNVRICRFVEFNVLADGALSIGNGTFIGRGSIISAHQSVKIGNFVLLAEYVCIHDNDHNFYDVSSPISSQLFTSSPILIGDNCWVGSGSVILRGSLLGSGSVLGAGSILTATIPPNSIAFGVPATVKGNRLSKFEINQQVS